MNSVFGRQYAWMTAMIFLSILLVGISFSTAASGYISDMQQTRMSKNAETISKLVSAKLIEKGMLDIQFRITLTAFGEAMTSHILVCNTEGTVVMCSDSPFCAAHSGKTVPASVTNAVLVNGSHTEQSSLGGLYPVNYNLAAHKVTLDSTTMAGMVIVASQASENRAMIAAFMRILSLISVIVLIFSFLSAYVITKRMTKPLKAMSVSARSYARGDFSMRVPVSHDYHDEVSLLCHNFNLMADSLQRLEELRQGFIANVSHELRTPMTVISGYVDGILDGTIPAESRGEYMKIIRSEILRLSRLVAKMLDISNMQSGHVSYAPKPVDICEFIRRSVLGFERRVESGGIEVECDLPDGEVTVSVDPDALTQVLTNLIDNALKFTPGGCRMTISVVPKNGKAYVSVSNTGNEIAPDDLPLLFDRFYKTDKSRSNDSSGLGLGLYIVKTILQSHGESIQVTSENGLTTFTFTLSLIKK